MEAHNGQRPDSPEQLALLTDAELAVFGRALLATLAQVELAPLLARHEQGVIVNDPAVVFALLSPAMSTLAQEQLRVLTLTTRHGLLGNHLIYQGTVSQAPVRPAEVFRPAVIQQAPRIIIAHNHPSGDPTMSADDHHLTRQLVEAGKILDIAVLDHVVIAGTAYTSCREQGLMPLAQSSPQRLSGVANGAYSDDLVVADDW